MNKKELKIKLGEAKYYRNHARYADAIALLHQIVEAYPETKYFYLLGGTYLEAGENDLALQYLDEALAIDPTYKNAYELKAKAYENKKEYLLAEQMYLKALDIDPDFFNARDSLVDLYWHKLKDYAKTIEQCEYVYNRQHIYTFPKEEFPKKDRWFSAFYPALRKSYLVEKRYDDLLKVFDRKKYIMDHYMGGEEDLLFSSEDRILYKLYYLWDNQEKLNELTLKFKEYYHVSNKFLQSMQKDAEQGYIDSCNWDNYEINSNGSFA